MSRPQRPVVRQGFFSAPLVVPARPAVVQLSQASQQASLDTLITAFTICVPVGGANSIWIGDSSIDPTLFNGIEVAVGTTKTIAINSSRQLYELQAPLIQSAPCEMDPLAIPFPVWDMASWYASASAQITVGLILFPEMFK